MASKQQLESAAVAALVDLNRRERAGERTGDFYRGTVQPAVETAVAAGCDRASIHADADRAYGRWLIANAGR
ncbi:hypothetical protein TPA0906_66550 [Streptomyces olivaceus]|uniref:hypothetical protein n=1 Tax=Streptomyces olivaceus TaxID=47716 RepID=UPI0022EE4D4F|nr:hypothetical protein [Streptomyces olivaceus]GHJ04790.1 hypothetical protein TPA0906_66550 [Streptomyces olivaceus]